MAPFPFELFEMGGLDRGRTHLCPSRPLVTSCGAASDHRAAGGQDATVVPRRFGVGEEVEEVQSAGQDERLDLVLVDRGTSEKAAARLSERHGLEVRRVGWDEPQLDEEGRRVFRPIRFAWRVEVAHGLLGGRRRLARSFENTSVSGSGWLHIACVAVLLCALVPPG